MLPPQYPVEPSKGLLGMPYTQVIYSTNKWSLNIFSASGYGKMLGTPR